MLRRSFIAQCISSNLWYANPRKAIAQNYPRVASIGHMQEAFASLRRLGAAFDRLDIDNIQQLLRSHVKDRALKIDTILQKYVLLHVRLDSNGIGVATAGAARPELAELGWRSFLVKVENDSGLKGPLLLMSPSIVISPNEMREGELVPGVHTADPGNDLLQILSVVPEADTSTVRREWLGYRFGDREESLLSGNQLEYHVLQIYCQSQEPTPIELAACAAKSISYLRGQSRGVEVRFSSVAASNVTIDVTDDNGKSTLAAFVVMDQAGRLYPAPAHRLEPDLCYQPQIYRGGGEQFRLSAGRYTVNVSRGPEHLSSDHELSVEEGRAATLSVRLKRWIHPAAFGWYSGDPHIHPEGQRYGAMSRLGLAPETMFRQVSGEGLDVGSILIWAGGYYYEKQFLTGHAYRPTYQLPFREFNKANNSYFEPAPIETEEQGVVRWDVEQAAFPSNSFCHPVLLGLKHHDYPIGGGVRGWPSWNLPILKWAKEQGAVVGYAHVGFPFQVDAVDLPNYDLPKINDYGTSEALVDVAHGALDFLAGTEYEPKTELNMWYHLLNCGFRTVMVGETDFSTLAPRAGTGRTYVKLDEKPIGDIGYANWISALAEGKVYFGDGRAHIIDFQVNDKPLGEALVDITNGRQVSVTAKVAALLHQAPVDADQDDRGIYWHLERARLPHSRNVKLELVVNGLPIEEKIVVADGVLRTVKFDLEVVRSSWIALRILPSVHSAPFFVHVTGKPVRASRRSADWCINFIDMAWNGYAERIRMGERAEAKQAFESAMAVYKTIYQESPVNS